VANRALLGAVEDTYGLRISKPTFNVLTTTLTREQLSFDSRWNWMSNCVLTGQATLGAAPSSPTENGTTLVVSYGQTLPAVPQILIETQIVGGDWTWFNPDHTGRFFGGSGRDGFLRAVTTTNFTLGNDFTVSCPVRYFVILP
jgi:hypothetical protein